MKIIKKCLALLLVMMMLFNQFWGVTVLALGIGLEPEIQTVSMDNQKIEPKGDIEIETHLVLPIRNKEKTNVVFTIYDEEKKAAKLELNDINKAQDGYYTTTLKLNNQSIRTVASKRMKNGHLLSGIDDQNNIVYFSINLYSLDPGTYTLEFSGEHFATYQVEVKLDKFSKRVSFTNEKGMFEIGDVNSDHVVNAKDSIAMMKAIREKTNDSNYDLNLDGTVDIADLNYITAILTGKSAKAKIEDTNAIIYGENISVDIEKEILAEDSSDLTALFTEDGTVKLKADKENPVDLNIDLSGDSKNEAIEMSEIRVAIGENVPSHMTFVVETKDGKKIEKEANSESTQGIHYFTDEVDKDTLVVKLGDQVAVKKVTIKVTGNSNNLADIAKVEFLNNVKVEAKEPEGFYTPKNIQVDASVSEQLTVSFNTVENVTGYEIKIVGPKIDTIFQTTYNKFTIEDLKNYATYRISVQSANQEWRSGWSDEIEAIPQATNRPPAVDMVVATPNYASIDFSWKNMDDTKTYNLYYREIGTTKWEVIREIANTKYSVKGLKAAVEYEAYLTGNNDLGEGSKSQTVRAKTKDASPTIVPKYKLINDYNPELNRTNHIKDVIYNLGKMVEGDKYSFVDDNFLTYWQHSDWQVSASVGFNQNAPIIVLDQSYQMDEFVITVPDTYKYSYKSGSYSSTSTDRNDILVRYWNDTEERTSANVTTVQGVMKTRTDVNGRKYYVLKLEKPITADAVQFGLTVSGNGGSIEIDEVKFYHYDSLVDDVAKLFTDDLRIELAKGVTQEKINDLRKRAETTDNGEYSPYKESILSDLEYAEKILNDEKIDDIITLNPNISNYYNGHLQFAMTISDYQPLGIVARPGDTLTIYVGSNGNVNAEVVYTQYYAEANAWQKTVSQKLQKGQNIINIDQIGSAESERGGSVYIRYTSKPDVNNPIKLRVSGGTKIPMVDTTLLTSEAEKKAAIKSYIEALENQVASLESVYAKEEKVFDKATSVLGSTEIVTKYGMFSVSSVAVKDALTSVASNIDEKVNRLYESMEAFDEMMEMFYRQKGLSVNAKDAKDEMPKARINIRYMRMFYGAFMYAGGYHVGIEYGSIAGLVQAHKNSAESTGYFGWGISHEVGHQINQKTTVFAEVTNNIYALLAQTSNDKDKSRLELSEIYEKIYDKVTSHTLGRHQNVFVQLGMYWQLHLAYDGNKTFDDTNSIYAKINHISRTYSNTAKYDRDDLTILFASKAAEKDLREFFEIWGLKASNALNAEMDELNLPKETRAIYYLNDQARRYLLTNGANAKMSDGVTVSASVTNIDSKDKRVTIKLNVSADKNKILGYEILRNGVSVGFVEGNVDSFTDYLGSENNRAYVYQVVAYDYLLNKTAPKVLEEIKIAHDGSVMKNTFTIESNVKAKDEIVDLEDDKMDYSSLSVNKLIDGETSTFFNGTDKVNTLTQNGDKVQMTTDDGNAYVIINLNGKLSVSGIKYRAALSNDALMENTIKNYKIYVSSDKVKWTEVKSGTFNLTSDNDYTDLVYFMKEGTTSKTQLWTYHDVSYIKIESVGNKNGLSGAEIDVIAPPGDNIDIAQVGSNPSIGVLEKDYCYLEEGCDDTENGKIVAGSVIIQGTYRGNPSFNVVTIGDSQNEEKLYDGYQLIFAELNDDKSVYEVADGTWIYVMTQEEYETMLNGSNSIRAYLYRVNDSKTNEGQRLTSTSKSVTNLKPYTELPKMTIEK